MRLAVMQPYFLPYLGYFQLLASVDRFVVLDDVNYIKRGWVNRNRILVDGRPNTFSLPVKKASQNKMINELELGQDYEDWARRFLKTIKHAYKKAPMYNNVMPLIEDMLACKISGLSTFLVHSLKRVCSYLGISTEIVETSSVYPRKGLSGSDRVLDICIQNCAETYVNLPGGRDLYDCATFRRKGISLEFLQPKLRSYPQGTGDFVSGLSVLDAMMCTSSFQELLVYETENVQC
ncbi:WbqC family protein [Desulfovibrio oxyclinae]|uniref:WbqC family protein n=1 Tax=Desulfovibrio oxyclinae TaxID=63560 RepID=UPI00035DB2BE|nr:WbqC family protein [Desulfovibrio oxyclinae]